MDTTCAYRIVATSRKVATNKNVCLTLAGATSTAPKLTMQPLPAAVSDPLTTSAAGQLWMFRPAAATTDLGCFTIHNLATGEAQCLERVGTSPTFDVRIAPLVSGKAQQIWYADTMTNGRILASSIQSGPRPVSTETLSAGGGGPGKLDIKAGSSPDTLQAITSAGLPTSLPQGEGTKWDIRWASMLPGFAEP